LCQTAIIEELRCRSREASDLRGGEPAAFSKNQQLLFVSAGQPLNKSKRLFTRQCHGHPRPDDVWWTQ
jgi:hypothetical protein